MSIRYTEEGQKFRAEKLKDLRARVSKLKRLETFRQSEEWKDLKSLLSEFVEHEKRAEKLSVDICEAGGEWDRDRMELKRIPSEHIVSDIRIARKGQADYQFVIDIIEKTEQKIDHLNSEIEKIEAQYKEAKEQIA